MNDATKNWGSIFFVLILAYLFINNATNSASVLNAIGNNVSNVTQSLQGRTPTAAQ